MESELKAQSKIQGMAGKGYLFDQYPYAEPNVRDYYNRFKKARRSRRVDQ
jgi:hypothetical protein